MTAAEPSGTPAPLTRRLLGLEVAAVLALSLGASAAYAVLDLARGILTAVEKHQALASQTAVLYGSADVHPYLDLAYQLVGVAVGAAPIVLVGYLLARSSEGFRTLGFDRTAFGRDSRWAAGLAAIVGAAGLASLVAFRAAGLNFTLAVGSGRTYWWTIPVLVLQAAGTAVSEEVIVGAYLLHRLEQLGWSRGRALGASALLRGSYHLYQGPGQFIANAVLGLFFGRIYQRTGRGLPLALAHFAVDAVAFVGFVVLRGHVTWLP